MRKRLLFLFLFLLASSSLSGHFVHAQDVTHQVSVLVNKSPVVFPDATAFVNRDGRTVVPIRALASLLGYGVKWNAIEQKLTLLNGSSIVTLAIGSRSFTVNGAVQMMDTTPAIIDGRTYVPLRFVVEVFSSTIEWDQRTLTANIIPPGKIVPYPESSLIEYGVYSQKTLLFSGTDKNAAIEFSKVRKNTAVYALESGELVYKNSSHIIVLDPGHGGYDSGAIALDGTYERTYNFTYASAAKTELEKRGYTVILTHDAFHSCGGYTAKYNDLQCRVDFATNYGADIFVSIHSNAFNFVQNGTETYYNARNDYDGKQNPYPNESLRLAQIIQVHTVTAFGTKNNGVFNQNFYVNRNARVPSALVELAYVDYAANLSVLKSTFKVNAFAVEFSNAMDEYFR